MNTIDKIKTRPWVAHVDDERGIGNSIIVMLKDNYVFAAEPDCGVRGFDTLSEAEQGTRKNAVLEKNTQ